MDACAYLVGPTDGPTLALGELARHARIGQVKLFRGIGAAEQQARVRPVCFFLFANVTDVAVHEKTVRAIRFSRNRALRFSPLIYFGEDASFETTRALIGMGFDDVITVPFTPNRVTERLHRQLDQTITFFETSSYFGPDRRRFGAFDDTNHAGRGSGGHHCQIKIVRKLTSGIAVVRSAVREAS